MFEIEELEEKQTKFTDKVKQVLCCKKAGDNYEENHRKLVKELIQDAPTKDELATHDGVVWFPKELMPQEPH